MHNVIFRDIQMHNSKSYQLIIAPVAGTLLCSERAEIVFASIRKPCCRWMFQWWGWQAGLKCTLGADSGCPAHRNTLWESLQKRNNPDKQPVKKTKKKKNPLSLSTTYTTLTLSYTCPLISTVKKSCLSITFLPLVAVKSRWACEKTMWGLLFFFQLTPVHQTTHSGHAVLRLLCNYYNSNLCTVDGIQQTVLWLLQMITVSSAFTMGGLVHLQRIIYSQIMLSYLKGDFVYVCLHTMW